MPMQRYVLRVVYTKSKNYGLYIKPKDSIVPAKVLSYSVKYNHFLCDTYDTSDLEPDFAIVYRWEATLPTEYIAEPISRTRRSHRYLWDYPWSAEHLGEYVDWLWGRQCTDPFVDTLRRTVTARGRYWDSRYRMMDAWLDRLSRAWPGLGSEFSQGVAGAKERLRWWNSNVRDVILAPENLW